ncbi:nickel import ATP-binding protein NikD [Enterobacter sp. PGRG2]|uniref:nickel import ATP-binding protein NikD n=1 Tax=Enterobacter sp. PGRG2 TaxID=3104013 RepID=UPI002ABDC887|nr:nickel import ATP-binding protein NikD [Enterobacter sp. PGRG2]WJD50632.1 nickel import ATP-binding protein NikD [Enterobacter sp. PGRG2]
MNTLTLDRFSFYAAGTCLVDNVSLTLRRGRVLALVGNSGCGKSLTCNGALGELPPGVRRTGGQVLLDGRVAAAHELRGRQVSCVMQNPRSAFNPLRTIRDHARETCQALGKNGSDALLLARLADVGLEQAARVLSLYPFEMSGGMLQRVMIALALLGDAPFMFADEPTTDLDAVAQARILDVLADVMKTRAPGMLLVTHDMGVVARLADEVAVMEQGRIVEQGTVDDLFYRPQHPLSRRLVSAHLALYGEALPQ